MSIFKIQTKDGRFAKPSSWCTSYTKDGKVWSKLHHLEAHLRERDIQTIKDYKKDGCEIVEYEMVEVARYPLDDILNSINDKKKNKEEIRALERQKRIEERERAELQRLAAKYTQYNL